MKSMLLKNFIDERMEENRELFTMEEMQYIKSNQECIYKVYLLGVMNSCDCFKNDKFSD